MVWLDVDAELAWGRCRGSGGRSPAIARSSSALYAEREPLYAELADAIVPSDRSTAMGQVLAALEGMPAPASRCCGRPAPRASTPPISVPDCSARTGSGRRPSPARRFLVTDGNVGARCRRGARRRSTGRVAIMPGEQSKTVAHAEIVWTELAARGDDPCRRGGRARRRRSRRSRRASAPPPTSGACATSRCRPRCVAQVDSAYGGKTGVDLAEAQELRRCLPPAGRR